MPQAEVDAALAARTLPEIRAAEKALKGDISPEANAAREQLQMMRLALEDEKRDAQLRKDLARAQKILGG